MALSLNMLRQSKSSQNAERGKFPDFLVRQYGQFFFASATQTNRDLAQSRSGSALPKNP